MTPRMAELYEIIKNSGLEIEKIQKECLHPNFEVGWYSWRAGALDVRRSCLECMGFVDGLTEEEEKEFRANSKIGQSAKVGSFSITITDDEMPEFSTPERR